VRANIGAHLQAAYQFLTRQSQSPKGAVQKNAVGAIGWRTRGRLRGELTVARGVGMQRCGRVEGAGGGADQTSAVCA